MNPEARPHTVTWIGDRWECSCGKHWDAADFYRLPNPERVIDRLAQNHYFENSLPPWSRAES